MKRRAILQSLVTVPASAVAWSQTKSQSQPSGGQAQSQTVTKQGVPAHPPTVAPGASELLNTPVIGADAVTNQVVRTFDAAQFAALSKLSEMIVPATEDEPGAKEAGAAEFLDFLVGCSPAEVSSLYKDGLRMLDRKSRETCGKSFVELDAGQAEKMLAPLQEAWSFEGPSDRYTKFLWTVRGDLLKATLNSRTYIEAVSQIRRLHQASGFYWYPMQ